MNLNNEWVIIGRFGRPHGIKGLVTINSFTEPRDNLFHYTDWHAYIRFQWVPIKVSQLEMRNQSILAKVEGYDDREAVAQLTNVDIAIQSTQLPILEPGDYYWNQLIGMKVIDQQGSLFGEVKEMLSTGANDVMVVVGDKRHLIPYLPGISIIEIDDNQRTITVDWDKDF